MPHHVECFGAALSVLAGHGHIKQRLTRAFEDNLTTIDEATLPQTLKDTFEELRVRLTSVEPLNGEGAICATVRKMSIDEADDCARRIVGMYGELLQSRDKPSAVAVKQQRSAEAAADVPALLLKSG